MPLIHSSGAQQSALVVHAPHVPFLHAWLLQSRQVMQDCGGGGQVAPALTAARSQWIAALASSWSIAGWIEIVRSVRPAYLGASEFGFPDASVLRRDAIDYFRKAIDYFREAIDYFRKAIDHFRKAIDYFREAIDYFREAIDCFREAIDYFRKAIDCFWKVMGRLASSPSTTSSSFRNVLALDSRVLERTEPVSRPSESSASRSPRRTPRPSSQRKLFGMEVYR